MPETDTSIILAAGRGQRLKELSLQQPKPMTVVNDRAIIDNLLEHLIAKGMARIVVVIGYMAEKLKSHIQDRFARSVDIVFVENDIFDETNNIYSLWLAREYMDDGFFLFEADVFCRRHITDALLDNEEKNVMLIDAYREPMNGTVVTLNPDSSVGAIILKKEQGENFDYSQTFKTLNFYKIGADFVDGFFKRRLDAYIEGHDVHSFYEQIFKEAVEAGTRFLGLKTIDNQWWEIDLLEDLQIAREMFDPE